MAYNMAQELTWHACEAVAGRKPKGSKQSKRAK